MTRVCCSCGWFVFTRTRCSRCDGIAVEFKAVRRALGAKRDLDVILASPERRMRALAVR